MGKIYEESVPESQEKLEEGDLLAEGYHDVQIEQQAIVHPSDNFSEGDESEHPDKLHLKLRVISGPCKGQTHNEYIRLPHPSEKEGTKRSRLMFLLRFGLISKEAFDNRKISVDYEALPLKGREMSVLISHFKMSDGRKFANVGFGGWHTVGYRGEGKTAEPKAASASSTASPRASKKSFDLGSI